MNQHGGAVDHDSPTDGTERLTGLGPVSYRYRRCRLTVLEGPDAGREQIFEEGSVTIGTRLESDLALSDRAVSRSHAVLELVREGFRLRDEASSNGTQVDGVRVNEAFLRDGSIITVGRTRIRFTSADTELEAPPSPLERFHGIIGRSAPMRQLFSVMARLAPTAVSVLVAGESGTGKEMVARALHAASPRAGSPLVVFDCANTDREFIRSELFGHDAGAFTGAGAAREGAFERADGGTVFLDELGELPLDLQPRLLRVLQERRVTRLGGAKERKVDVRVVSATNRDLPAMVARGQFREDLYYRMAQIVIRVPALRERREDVAALAEAFLSEVAPRKKFSAATLQRLAAQAWPGNVRELRNCVEVSAALAAGEEVHPGDLQLTDDAATTEAPAAPQGVSSLDDVEKRAVETTLRTCEGNISKTARALGITRPTLRAKLRKFGLREP